MLNVLENIPKEGSEWFMEDYTSNNAANVVRALLQPVTKHPALSDELLVQLTRFTCEYDQPDCNNAIIYWKLLLIVVNCVKPLIAEVGDYIKSHVKRASTLDEKMSREKMRLFEAKHADACLKVLRKSVNVDPRKFVPSREEIDAVMVLHGRGGFMYFTVQALKPLRWKIYFPDGQYRTVTFDPHVTGADLLSECQHFQISLLNTH